MGDPFDSSIRVDSGRCKPKGPTVKGDGAGCGGCMTASYLEVNGQHRRVASKGHGSDIETVGRLHKLRSRACASGSGLGEPVGYLNNAMFAVFAARSLLPPTHTPTMSGGQADLALIMASRMPLIIGFTLRPMGGMLMKFVWAAPPPPLGTAVTSRKSASGAQIVVDVGDSPSGICPEIFPADGMNRIGPEGNVLCRLFRRCAREHGSSRPRSIAFPPMVDMVEYETRVLTDGAVLSPQPRGTAFSIVLRLTRASSFLSRS